MPDQRLEIIFWGSLGLILYTYLVYPAVVVLLGACWKRRRTDSRYTPALSVLIAAYNEETSIAAKVRATLELDYPPGKLEVVVVSDGSTDRTNEILADLAGERVHVHLLPRGGKTRAQNYGVTQCRGDVVVFSDATSVYDKGAVRALAGYYADPTVGAVGGVCHFYDARKHGSPTGLGQVAYGGYEQAIRIAQSRISTATACSGAIYSTRRDLYVPLAPDACSDMMEPIEIVRAGRRVVYTPEARAYEAAATSVHTEFRMRVRVATQGMQGVLAAGRLLLFQRGAWISLQLISHKALRYLLPLPLLLLLATSAWLAPGHAGFMLVFLAQVLFYGLAALSVLLPERWRGRLLSLPLFFCTGNVASVAALWQVARGNRFHVWETVRK
jgi:cellulose synthase/poly-beta-1,6-N-acetylglucosamine synthase-like glycosyltransferase